MNEPGATTSPNVRDANHEFEPLLDSEEAGKLLHLHPESVKRLARTGRIVAVKLGGVWRFRISALEIYVQQATENTQTRLVQNMAPSVSAICGVAARSRLGR